MGDFDELEGHNPAAEEEAAGKADKAEKKAEEPKPEPPKPSGGDSKQHH